MSMSHFCHYAGGAVEAAAENSNAEQFREMSGQQDLNPNKHVLAHGCTCCLPQIGKLGRNSRIDHVCAPQSMQQRFTSCKVHRLICAG